MPVGVCVVAGRDLELVALFDQRSHCVRRRAIHADLPIPVESHEPPCRVDVGVHDGQVQAVALPDDPPVRNARPAERVSADAHPGSCDGCQVDGGGEVGHIGVEEVIGVGGSRGAGSGDRNPVNPAQPTGKKGVGPVLDHRGHIGAGRTAVGWVVLEPAIRWRIVRRSNDDPVRGPAPVPDRAVVGQHCVGQGRRRRVTVASVDQDCHLVSRQHLHRGHPRRLRQGMGVTGEEQRPVGTGPGPVVADRLGGGANVVVVEAGPQARPSVPGGPERHPLVGDRRVGMLAVVRGDEASYVDEVATLGRLSGTGIGGHGKVS